MRFLLDCDVLIALTNADHTSHERATVWFKQSGQLFATCPITQGALIRLFLRVKPGSDVRVAKRFLGQITSRGEREFWPDSVSFEQLPEAGVRVICK